MVKLEWTQQHHYGSCTRTTPSNASRSNDCLCVERQDNRSSRSSNHDPTRRGVPRTTGDRQTPRGSGRSPLLLRNLPQQMEYGEYYPRRAKIHLPFGMVMYELLVMLTLLSRKECVMIYYEMSGVFA